MQDAAGTGLPSAGAAARRRRRDIRGAFRCASAVTAVVGVVASLSIAGAGALGARVNTSPSVALGLYWTTRAPLTQGSYVLLCPPQRAPFDQAFARGYVSRGRCRGGYGYLIKQVAALAGDVVSIDDDGVRVNGRRLLNSAPQRADRAGRVLPRLRFGPAALGATEVLLMSDGSPTAFDARYFGAIDRAQIRSVLRPVLTWREGAPY